MQEQLVAQAMIVRFQSLILRKNGCVVGEKRGRRCRRAILSSTFKQKSFD